jgi:phosphoglycolate phosphatase
MERLLPHFRFYMSLTPRPTRVAAVVFDLDGTLLDTLEDIAAAGNAALARVGAPPHPAADFRQFIGEGVNRLFEQSLPPEQQDLTTIARCAAAFQETYAQEWNQRSTPYPGIPELLDALTERGIKLAVLSNKPHDFTAACVKHYLAAWRFAAVLGPQAGVPRKPDPAGALRILHELHAHPEQCLYVGDTGIDMQTACAAGLYAVGVSWGFRPVEELRGSGADIVLDAPGELLSLVTTVSS